MPETVDPTTTAFAPFLERSAVPVGRHDSRVSGSSSSRAVGFAWDVGADGKSVRARQRRHLLRAPEHAEPGRIGHDQRHPAEERLPRPTFTAFADMPVWPNLLPPSAVAARARSRSSPASASSTATTRTRASTASTSGYERELAPSIAGVRRLHRREGRAPDAVPELQRPRHGRGGRRSRRRATRRPTPAPIRSSRSWATCSSPTAAATALYRGATFGVRKRFSQQYQFEANYVLAKDEDDDSNERDPFTDRSFNFYDLSLDYGPSDRDIRHKVNFFTYAELPKQFLVERARAGAHGAADHDVAARAERRRSRPQLGSQGQRVLLARLAPAAAVHASAAHEVIPSLEMFNTFNNANNVNPLTTPPLFNFDGFLRAGVGDPRQVQLAAKVTF